VITVTCKCGHKQEVGDYPSRWKCSKCGQWQNYDPVIDNPARLLVACQRAMEIMQTWTYDQFTRWQYQNVEPESITDLIGIHLMGMAFAIAEDEQEQP
jgi:hypothetical protein